MNFLTDCQGVSLTISGNASSILLSLCRHASMGSTHLFKELIMNLTARMYPPPRRLFDRKDFRKGDTYMCEQWSFLKYLHVITAGLRSPWRRLNQILLICFKTSGMKGTFSPQKEVSNFFAFLCGCFKVMHGLSNLKSQRASGSFLILLLTVSHSQSTKVVPSNFSSQSQFSFLLFYVDEG